MNNKLKIGLIIVIIIFLMGITLYLFKPTIKTYSRNLFYMDTYINIKVYTSNKSLANQSLDEAEKIYQTYHQLADRFTPYDNINNLYYIRHNKLTATNLNLDPKLYDLIKYGISWYNQSNGIKNINLGNVIDVWKKYRDLKTGIPSLNELKNAGSTNIKDIVLLPNNQILNNHPNIDLGSIVKGYATQVVGDYLKQVGLPKYLINAGGNVLVGDHDDDGVYRIGIQDPTKPNEVFQVVKGNNLAVVTSGGYQRFYEYQGVKYNHIIDPNTLFPADKYYSVSVVCDSSTLGDSLSLVLFVMDIEQGKALIKKYDNVEVIWYTKDNQIIKSSGFDKYE